MIKCVVLVNGLDSRVHVVGVASSVELLALSHALEKVRERVRDKIEGSLERTSWYDGDEVKTS